MVLAHPPSLAPQWPGVVLNALAHRGPDDLGWMGWGHQGIQQGQQPQPLGSERVWLGHRRLSILDLSQSGHQPMSYANGPHHIVFNGEIYNYLELRSELQSKGYTFRSSSDTEVLLAAWKAWGPQSLTRLVGMFAFALLDRSAQTVYLVRDFFGIKPLYYARWQGGLAFASEIPPLLKLPGVSRTVNAQRMYHYLRFGLTDDGEGTLLQGVQQVPPAHYLKIQINNPAQAELVRYWQVQLGQPAQLKFADAVQQVREVFLDNVRLHLRSDVPVGAALSGGIDSSAIVCAMRHLEPNLDLHTFSFIADDAAISEERWVDIVGGATQAKVHKVRATAQELVNDLDTLIAAQGEPFGSTSIYAQHRVFRLAAQSGIKVMLDGQGADELLGGYAPYSGARLASLLKQGQIWAALRFWQQAAQQPGRGPRSMLRSALGYALPAAIRKPLRKMIGNDLGPEWLTKPWFIERGVLMMPPKTTYGAHVLRDELKYALEEISIPMLLRYEDRNSMHHSIESRVPFLTPKLAQLLLNLPEEHLISSNGTTKHVFREAMRGIVPNAILDRKDKIGFQTPEQRWLGTLAPWVEGHLQSAALQQIPALNAPAVLREWQAIRSGQKPFDYRVWRWINTVVWSQTFDVQWA